ncbi:hypothetical protein F5I97DRAFT_1816081 [Phlebopus sp. FC_14]|nr:hypothetical protein F5I97DRAFT_1816081 [Phlebopus sp. FC_14]
MTRLHLKRTPAEEEERARRKARKAARKELKKKRRTGDGYTSSDSGGLAEASGSKKRRRHDISTSVDDEFYGSPPASPPSSAYKVDYDAIRADIEERRFREKMWGALEDDERLEAIDSRFNDYSHIPKRWRDQGDLHDDRAAMDPQYMDDDEYAEWIREGMWRKKHAQEHEELAQKQAEKAARMAREKEIKAETARIEKAALARREQRRRGKEKRREEEYRIYYDKRWKELLDPQTEEQEPFSFAQIPWPLLAAQHLVANNAPQKYLAVEEFTVEAISAFILPSSRNPPATSPKAGENERRERKDRLRETMLRFHPDKFEGRMMQRVLARDKDRIKEAVGQVARALNTLMNQEQ